MLRVIQLQDEDFAAFGPRIAAIERGVSYPLGTDRFEIDHGSDYFAFFRRLGRLRYYVALDAGALAGVLAAVEREIAIEPAKSPLRCTYLCDLKAAPGRPAGRVLQPLLRAWERDAPQAPVYGISMNAADGSNRLVGVLLRRNPSLRAAATLHLFSLDADTARNAARAIALRRGATPSWLSLAGVKDIVLASTGAPLRLLHAQYGPCAERGAEEPVAGAVHMLCVSESDLLRRDLAAFGCEPSASATVIARGMEGADFNFVLTRDI